MSFFGDFADNLESSLSSIFTSPASYTAVGSGTQLDCNIVVDTNALVQPEGFDVDVYETATVVEALVSEVGVPEIGATFVQGSTTYTVKRIDTNDSRFVRMVVK